MSIPLLNPRERFRIAMPVFPCVTQLDLTGPHEVFGRVPGVEIELVWKNLAPVRAQAIGGLGLSLTPTATFTSCAKVDLLCVPGGIGCIELLCDEEVTAAIAQLAASASYITSVCTGSLVLGAAGLLRGYRATCHWTSLEELKAFGAIPVDERVVVDRDRITGAGVTSGIDFALRVIGEIWGRRAAEMAQLSLEYDPAPPFSTGSPKSAPAELVALLQTAMSPVTDRRREAIARAAARLGKNLAEREGLLAAAPLVPSLRSGPPAR